jgi:hypothetical protein
MACLYIHRRKDNFQVFYVGIGRSKKRAYSKYSRNKHWESTVKKYGHIVQIIMDDLSWEEACSAEIYLIKSFGRKDLGGGILVNMTNGGEGVENISTESREKMRKAKIGFVPWNKGIKTKPLSKEHREKISKIHLGKIVSEETKKKISEAQMAEKNHRFGKGHLMSGDKNPMFGRSGDKNPMFGKDHTDDFKEKMKELYGNKLIYNGVEYLSIREASRKTGNSRYLIKKSAIFKS